MNTTARQKRISAFIKNNRERLVHYVHRFVDDTAELDGEDIVQDVIANLFDRADITLPIENLAAYVYQALRNRIIDAFRKRKKNVLLEAEILNDENRTLSELLPDPEYERGSADQRVAFRQRLFQCLSELNDDERDIIIASEMENRSFKALSEEWQVPLGTLLARKSRALKKIRSKLSEIDNE